MDVKEMIREGYSSLASETIELYDGLMGSVVMLHPDAAKHMKRFRSGLSGVRASGDIRAIGKKRDRKKTLSFVMDVLSSALPETLSPQDTVKMMSIASSSVRAHFGIPDFKELLRRGRIDSLGPEGPGGLALMGAGDRLKRILYVHSEPNRAVSVLANIHEFYHSLQPEHSEIYDILSRKSDVPGFGKLMMRIKPDDELMGRVVDVAMSSHELRFYSQPEILSLAEEVGIDMAEWRRYLDENVPRMDFLTCFTEGEAYVMERDVIAGNPDLRDAETFRKVYELIALVDILNAAFQKPKERIYEVGIGTFRYMKDMPEEMERLKGSSDFHMEISEAI